MGHVGSAAESTTSLAFKPGQDLIHFNKHSGEIADVLGHQGYTLGQYVADANSVIKNGKFAPELNGYVAGRCQG